MVLLLGLAGKEALSHQRTYSPVEKRELQTRPEISITKVLDGRFQKKYESYLRDQFPGRDHWVSFQTDMELFMGKNEIHNVYIGKNHYLLEHYTEKEFDYAVSQGIPVLAFIIEKSVSMAPDKYESDPLKKEKLDVFKEKVKNSGRYVKFWKNKDNLESLISQSISKSVTRGRRPGWVRTTDFDIDKSHAEILRLTERVHTLEALNADLKKENFRKPNLWVDIQPGRDEDGKIYDEGTRLTSNGIHFTVVPIITTDVKNGLDYKDWAGRWVHESKDEVRLLRYVYENSFVVYFRVHNDGDARATGVRVKLSFPNDLMVLSERELLEYRDEEAIHFEKDAYRNWRKRFENPKNIASVKENDNKFISLDELITVEDIADLMDPADMNEVVSILPGEILFDKNEVRHKDTDCIYGVCVLPTRAGQFTVKCEIICNEYAEVIKQDITVEVE